MTARPAVKPPEGVPDAHDHPPSRRVHAAPAGAGPGPQRIPFVYRVNGGSARPLSGWEHLRELLHLLGLHPSMSFVLVEPVGPGERDRWVQALGSPERMVVEVAAGDGPMRVTRREATSRPDDVRSAQGYRVRARSDELWSAEPALAITRSWLTGGALPPELDAGLVQPLDFR